MASYNELNKSKCRRARFLMLLRGQKTYQVFAGANALYLGATTSVKHEPLACHRKNKVFYVLM